VCFIDGFTIQDNIFDFLRLYFLLITMRIGGLSIQLPILCQASLVKCRLKLVAFSVLLPALALSHSL